MITYIKRIAPAVLFVLAACAIATAMILSEYTTAYAVSIDGELWGYVSDNESVDNAVEKVEDEVGKILDCDYALNSDVTCKKTFINKNKVKGNADELAKELYDAVPDIMDSYVLRVDGELIGSGDELELTQVVENVKNQYVNDNTVEVTILSDVNVDYETIPSNTESDAEIISEVLNEVTDSEVIYQVHDGETIADVAENTEVSVQQIITLNPELNEVAESAEEEKEKDVETDETNENVDNADAEEHEETENTADIAEIPLENGMMLTIEPETVRLSVQSVDLEYYEEEIDYETEEIEDETLYIGESEIQQEGENGIAEVSEYVTKINGTETERVYNQTDTIKESVPEIIAVGIKENPSEINVENVEDNTGSITTEGSDEEVITGIVNEQAGEITNNEINTEIEIVENNSDSNIIQSDNSDLSETTDSEYSDDIRVRIVNYALQFCGCPYVHGGHGPNVFDCSGFTGYLYRQFGYNLPYTVEGQLSLGTVVNYGSDPLQLGDLIFFATTGTGYATHVGMYIGNNQYIHASSTYGQVMIDTVRSPSYRPIVGVRRIIN